MLGQHRSTQRKVPRGADDEQALTEDIIVLAKQYGRYGYRRVTALLCHAGWKVNHKRVERIWRRKEDHRILVDFTRSAFLPETGQAGHWRDASILRLLMPAMGRFQSVSFWGDARR